MPGPGNYTPHVHGAGLTGDLFEHPVIVLASYPKVLNEIAHRVEGQWLRKGFAVFMVIVAMRMFLLSPKKAQPDGQPASDQAQTIPHNMKVYNSCRMKKMGLAKRPESIPKRQAIAAVGQAGLILRYKSGTVGVMAD